MGTIVFCERKQFEGWKQQCF